MCALLCSCHHYTPKIFKKQQILNKIAKISNTLHTFVFTLKTRHVILKRRNRGNGEDQARILRTFQFSGTKILTLNKVHDLAGDDEFDEEFFEFGLFVSRREYKMIKRRGQRRRNAPA